MMNAFRAFKTATTAQPHLLSNVFEDDVDAVHGGTANTPFHAAAYTFDRATYELKLPRFLQQHESTPITLTDGAVQSFGGSNHPDPHHWQAELHLLYLAHPELCSHCSCPAEPQCQCPTYTKLWDTFLEEKVVQQASKDGLANQLELWHDWAEVKHQAGLLTPRQVRSDHICDRCMKSLHDRHTWWVILELWQVSLFICMQQLGARKPGIWVWGWLCAGVTGGSMSQ